MLIGLLNKYKACVNIFAAYRMAPAAKRVEFRLTRPEAIDRAHGWAAAIASCPAHPERCYV